MKQLKISIFIFLLMSLVTGIIYPLSMTGIAQLMFHHKANGSLIKINGRTIGSELIGQGFASKKYFHERPSAVNYNGGNSGASNFGPTNRKHIQEVLKRAELVRGENGMPADSKIPSDLVTASGSGLDPHISLESALLQAQRIAKERDIDTQVIINLINATSERFYWGLFGHRYVNVLTINIALDNLNNTI